MLSVLLSSVMWFPPDVVNGRLAVETTTADGVDPLIGAVFNLALAFGNIDDVLES